MEQQENSYQDKLFSVIRPQTMNAQGLFDVVEASLQKFNLQSIDSVSCKKLVGMWSICKHSCCQTKRAVWRANKLDIVDVVSSSQIKISYKKALNNTSFDFINELLLKLYYIYHKSTKTCRELEDIVSD